MTRVFLHLSAGNKFSSEGLYFLIISFLLLACQWRASTFFSEKPSNEPLHEAATWYKICHAGWQATQWYIQNKEKSRLAGGNRFVLEAVAFFFHPAWRILSHVTVSRKEPIGLK